MSISQVNICLFDRLNRPHQPSDNKSQTENSSFKEILQAASQNKVADGKDNLTPLPLSKTQLIDMINNIKSQMDTRLLQTLSMETKTESDFPSSLRFLGQFSSPENNMSNKWHSAQNDDIQKENTDLNRIIAQTANMHGVDEALVKSVIKVESNFNSKSTSSKGAMGLMQLMPDTARELGVRNPYDPVENIEAGTRYLKKLLNRYDGNVSLSLAAYNWGMGNIERKPEQIPIETRQYVAKVIRHYEILKG